jgi:hypothetical protein
MVTGEAHGVNAGPSRAHSNVAGSLAVNSNVAVVAVVGFAGPEVIEVSGAVVSGGASTSHTKVAGDASTLPAPSIARTRNSCEPAPIPE